MVLQLALAGILPSLAAAEPAADFVLREHLGYDWRHERVTFPLSAAQAAQAKAGKPLIGPDDQALAYQIVSPAAGEDRICFQADLPSYETASFQFGAGAAAPATDLKVEESAELITITNGLVGVRIRRRLDAGAAPIAGIRLAKAGWTGGSTLSGAPAVARYEAKVVATGPVFAEVECATEFADGGHWTIRFVVEAAEPVVLVSEAFDAPGGGTMSVLLGGGGFRPANMLYRNPDVVKPVVTTKPVGSFYLEPWLHWNNPGHGTWLAVHASASQAPAKSTSGERPPQPPAGDMLVLALLRPSLWVDPAWAGKAPRAQDHVAVADRDGILAANFVLAGGRREWLLGGLDQASSLALVGKRAAAPPQKLVIKHGDFPLNRVKDFVLEWEGDHDNHPRLYVKKADIPELRKRVQSDPKELARWSGKQPIDKYQLDGPVREFIATGDPKLGKLMAQKAEQYLQEVVDWYLVQDDKLTPSAAPHMQSLLISVVNLIDPVLGSEAYTPEARRKVLARLAFVGYVTSSPDYWSPERGFTSFANMTSVVAMYRTALGCMIPSHPEAKGWAEQGLKQLAWELTAWSDQDGGWIEAPHYAMVSFDHLIAGFIMAANAGYSDRLYDPRMREVIEWFALISTPPDARTGGWRHQPPIGNTYPGEPNGIYGIVATLWKNKDPEFAAHMQWLFEQHGSTPDLGSGWNFPTMVGYRFLMKASGVRPKPATEFGSAHFRKTGVVLRNSMQTDRETYLHMIAGSNHEHYDADSGSIMLYGKGRVLSDDWGYHGLHPAKWHSMVTGSGAAGGDGIMKIAQFAPAKAFDFVSGSKAAWTRQIGFAKDADPLGPNFFVVRDSYSANDDATWRLWLTTGVSAGPGNQMPADGSPGGTVTLTEFGATLSGIEDVDLDIFLQEPTRLGLKLEPAKLLHKIGNWKGRTMPVELSQTALVGTLSGSGAVTAVLYPRLKTEPRPKVAFSADGRVAEVRSPSGVDYVFLSTVEHPPHDGKTLEPLRRRSTNNGVVTTCMEGDERMTVVVTPPDSAVADGSRHVPAASVALHPGPVHPVTAVWQSPVAGRVGIEVKLRDGDSGGGDGILYAVNHKSRTLAKGALANGGPEQTSSIEKVEVDKGDLVRLVILPGQTDSKQTDSKKSNWWDTTLVDFIITDETGRTWNFRDAIVGGEKLGNERAHDLAGATWWVCSGDAETFAPATLQPPPSPSFTSPDGKVTFQGSAGSVRARGSKTTLTLGAAGRINAGGKDFAADGPATKD